MPATLPALKRAVWVTPFVSQKARYLIAYTGGGAPRLLTMPLSHNFIIEWRCRESMAVMASNTGRSPIRLSAAWSGNVELEAPHASLLPSKG